MHLSTKRRLVLGFSTGGLLVGGLGMGVAQADAAANGGAAGSPGLLSGNLVQIPINAPVNVCGNSISVIGVLDSATGNTCVNSGSNGATANGGATDSPGAGSGNLIQVPITAPVNLCGNSASGVGVGDSAVDNKCSNGAPSGSGAGGAGANGGSHGSPGVGSGNTVQLPVNAPVNVCGNSVSVIGILDTAADNTCSNGGSGGSGPTPPPCGCHPTPPGTPPSTPPTSTTPPPPNQTTPPPPPSGGRPHGPVPPHHAISGNGTGTVRPGTLAETGTGAGDLVAPLGAGMLGGTGLLLRRRVSTLHRHAGGRK